LVGIFSGPQTQLRFQTEIRARAIRRPVDGRSCSQLPNSESAAVQARSVGAIDIAEFIRERYGRCRISSPAMRIMPKGPSPPLVVAPWEISAETQSQSLAG
jgi:hypothetical protein